MSKNYFKQLYLSFETIFIYFVFGCIPFLFTLFSRDASKVNSENIYNLYFNIFSKYVITFLLIPSFVFLIKNNARYFDDLKVIIRFVNKSEWWNKRLIISAFECLIFTLFTNMLVYSYIFLNNKFMNIDLEFVLFTFKNSILHFLGYLVMMICFIIVSFKFGKVYIGVLVVLFIFFIDFMLFFCGYDFSIILNKMFVFGSYTYDINLNFFVACSSFYLCAAFLLLNILGYKIIKGKDLF